MEYKGIDYLRKKLQKYKPRVDVRYSHYDMKYSDASIGLVIPPQMRANYRATLGWCTKAVDILADRLVFREFRDETGSDVYDINEIFKLNNADNFFDSAILSSLIASCCFVYISKGEDEYPRLQVIEANNATGVIDPITGLLEEGYAVLKRDKRELPTTEAYFTKEYTEFIYDGNRRAVIENNTGQVLLVPVIHRPDAVRPFGRSRITRSAVYYQNHAKRTLERADISAEFYSFPQKYVLGTSQDSEPLEGWKATIATMLEFTKDEDGDRPSIGQFQQQSMTPYSEQLRTIASGFAGETGLTLNDLGFVTDNPASSEAIKASHETLRLMARKAQRNFGSGFLNVGYVACCLRDDYPYARYEFSKIKPKWEPVFEPDMATLSSAGDGVIKINQTVPEYFNKENLRDIIGIEGGINER